MSVSRDIGRRMAWVVAACVLIAVGLTIGRSYWQRPRLNLLLVTLDTTRADHLGCYGHAPALTPVLDELSARGVLFERAYATAPLTLPAHASMFTGLYPPEHGLHTNGKNQLDQDLPTLAETLLARGYATGAFVASFVLDSKFGLNQGFQHYGDDLTGTGTAPADEALHRSRSGNFVVDEALSWLEGHAQQPFFCWVHLYDPHAPYLDHRETFGERFADRPYDAEIAFVDLQIGRLRTFLQERRLEERTLIVVIGDHGEGLDEHEERRHGLMLYNSTMHVPWIMASAGQLPAGRRMTAPVSQVDLLPTLLDLLNFRENQPVSGRSLLAALKGTNLESRVLYGETDEPFLDSGWSPLRSLTSAEWKFIRTTRAELYDLVNDPAETHNLAAESSDQVEVMVQQLADLESRMRRRRGAAVQLSQEEQKRLTSLGYVGNTAKIDPDKLTSHMPDIKDMVAHYNTLEDAHLLLDAGDFDKAAQTLQKLVAAAPDYEQAEVALGDAFFKQKKFDEASSIYVAILKRNPESALAKFHLGDVREAQGRLDEAIRHYEEALAQEPDSAKLNYNLGRAYVRLGNDPSAIPHFEAALQLDPGFVFAHIEWGTALARQGLLDEALAHLQTALKYDPLSVHAHMNAAMVLSRQGRHDGVLHHLERAAEISPGDAEIQFQLGAYLAARGMRDRALVHLQEAEHLQPGKTRARDILEKIERQDSR